MSRQRTSLVAGMLSVVAVGAFAAPAAAQPAWRVIDLGVGDNSVAYAINDHGQIVGDHEGRPFLWDHGKVTYLESPGPSSASDINNKGDIVGSSVEFGALLWRHGKLIEIGAQSPLSFANAINDRGEIVGYSWGAASALLWRNGVLTQLVGLPGAITTFATDVNDRGVVAGETSQDQFAEKAVLWRHGTLEIIPAVRAEATAINNHDMVTGLYWGTWGNPHGFVWDRGRLIHLAPRPQDFALQPFGINDRGQVVGGTGYDAFVWQDGTMTYLPRLVSTSTAHAINERGQIVGSSSSQSDGLVQHAVLWTRDKP